MNKKVLIITLVLMLMFSNFVFAGYFDDVIVPIELKDKYYVIHWFSGTPRYSIYYSDTPLYLLDYGGKVSDHLPKKLKGSQYAVHSNDGQIWGSPQESNGLSFGSEIEKFSPEWSANHDVKYGDEVFFSVPQVTITEVIQEETAKIIPDLVGKTKTILLVGFGVLSAMLLVRLLTVYFRR